MSIPNNPIWFVANLAGFQLSWWTLVLYGNSAIPLALGLLALHFAFVAEKLLELRIIAVVAMTGIIIDSTLTQLSVWQFTPKPIAAPIWLCALWLSFAATLRHSLKPLWEYRRWWPLLGAFGGTSSYLGAYKLGAVSLGYNVLATAVICAALWALIFPLALHICERSEREEQPHAA
ncbi:DUF2878 domain-containing protein [Pseudoteredinibacter isoporae]|uniref:DUF2878 domain-containing protein n=1 Tax=Pseudoteredinibacter isoporae TaxID=570281 RepID=A0A7X0JX54_9GAMM|nr:DUF2878 domain-containing protein [Pseudoteredinibacter isoporae]MBB6523031.1 hypothetical protein [Pseudoteredinibacter isoporae]NHO88553.1 DUF2878 domain-containing protein [Pseudoteredinibacter isoporae]NIB22756.1 DUF2878 domain-containing protein [Pseudoteredinibacter isoporae]